MSHQKPQTSLSSCLCARRLSCNSSLSLGSYIYDRLFPLLHVWKDKRAVEKHLPNNPVIRCGSTSVSSLSCLFLWAGTHVMAPLGCIVILYRLYRSFSLIICSSFTVSCSISYSCWTHNLLCALLHLQTLSIFFQSFIFIVVSVSN